MDVLTNLQLDVNSVISRAIINFKKSPKERITVAYLETRLENLEEQWKSFLDTHRTIISDVDCKEYKNSNYYNDEIYEKTQELYCEYKTELKDNLNKIVKPFAPVSNDSVNFQVSHPNATSIPNVKLPKITIPTFSGKYTEWTTFKDLFLSLVHNNASLENVHKLHYLKAHLTGEAEQLLRHVPVTDANYTESWSVLTKRYSNKKFLSNCLLKRLISQSNVTVESANAIKELLDTTSDSLNGLKNLGLNTDSWDVLVIYLISSKLDSESRKLWEAKISTVDEHPTMSEFKEFLEHRFRSLEFLPPKSMKQNYGRYNNYYNNANVHHTSTISCPFCKENHKLCNCKNFAKQNCETRRSFVQTNSLCFNCMGPNHSVFTCRQSSRCRICKKKHHSLLHFQSVPKSAENNVVDSSADQSVVVAVSTSSNQSDEVSEVVACHSDINSHVLLATALVRVESQSGNHLTLRSLLDQGSQASFITESAVQSLGLRKVSSKVLISGVGDNKESVVSKSIVCFSLQSIYKPKFKIKVKAHVLNKLTSILPIKKVHCSIGHQLAHLQLADPKFHIPNKIDLLLGAEIFGQILDEGLIKGPPGSPIAQNTKFGWILSGQVYSGQSDNSQLCNSHVVSLHTFINSDDLLKKFWEMESEPSVCKEILTQEEQECEDFYSKTTTRDSTGRYIVQLPFKSSDPQCQYGNTKAVAAKRLNYLVKRLAKTPELKVQYSQVLSEYLDLGHMEVVKGEQLAKPNVVYLPHHAVVREERTTTKVRVVFDASSSGSNGVSLNSDLMVGPRLQRDLRHIIMRWRRYPVAIIADIVKMYRQIKVHEKDADFQRIMWLDDSGIQYYRLLRVTFGTASAPYLAVKTLQQLAIDEGESFPLAAKRVLNDFYVDDLMSGGENIEEGFRIYSEVNELLEKGGFEIQKWCSSHKELMNLITNGKERKLEIGTGKESSEIKKVLGLSWNNVTDEFEYNVQLPTLSLPVTKRKVVSDISRLFDPLGWIAPSIIQAKIFIQKLWISGLEWDQVLTDSLLQEWINYRNNLTNISKFTIGRWMHTSKSDELVELHGFCDASEDAFAAVVYLRVVDSMGKVHVNLVTSKTKVAPIKRISIPRLELCGAVLLAKLLAEVAEVLEVSKSNIHAWTDSQVVLAWLSSHPSRWKTFIANRVSEILSLFDRNQWSHVRSEENSADCASRGIQPTKPEEILLWKFGPSWLSEKSINYSPLSRNQDTDLESRTNKKVVCAVVSVEDNDLVVRFSSFRRLVRVLSQCRRFIKIAYSKIKNQLKPVFPKWITNLEIEEVIRILIKDTQITYFKEEIRSLSNNVSVNSKSNLCSLTPFVDSLGILRVGGRLQNSQLAQNAISPIILPYKSHLTELIIADAHDRTLHGGVQLMLNYLRSKFWIICARRAVKNYVYKCISCVRYSSRTTPPLMGQLPTARVTPSRPFQQSGVDYAGPISIRTFKGRGHRSAKGYICLFVCMSTRAIHLEAVSDLTSQGFIAAFKRFVARRGHCSDLWSDNGTNFVGAARELKSLLVEERSLVKIEIADWLATNGTEWHFIPPHAPNFGGLWEAGVKSTKYHLRRVIGVSTLTFEEISTVLAQIEACLNSRPMSQISDDSHEPYPLTPGHFLVGSPLVLPPDTNYESSNISTLRRWQYTQKMVQDFWRKWSQEYLTHFLQRHKWSRHVPEPKLGSIVLVKEDDLPPARWLYGIVIDKHPGLDQVTRVVTLKCKGSIIKRPVMKLCVLPVTE